MSKVIGLLVFDLQTYPGIVVHVFKELELSIDDEEISFFLRHPQCSVVYEVRISSRVRLEGIYGNFIQLEMVQGGLVQVKQKQMSFLFFYRSVDGLC